MNIRLSTTRQTSTRHRQGGMAVIVMLALLAIMLLYVAANLRSLNSLKWELKLTEQRQVRRLNAISAAHAAAIAPRSTDTNAPATNQPSLTPPARE